jgi:hypothetical protein
MKRKTGDLIKIEIREIGKDYFTEKPWYGAFLGEGNTKVLCLEMTEKTQAPAFKHGVSFRGVPRF